MALAEATPSISCVMPVRNGATYIAAAVASLVAQSLRPGQIVVVDDGSKDDSGALAVAAGGSLVDLVTTGPQGLDAARNRGCEAARGDFIHFLDLDDIVPPGSLAAMHEALATNPEWGAVFGRWRNVWIDALAAEEEAPANAHLRGEQSNITLTSGLFRREVLTAAGPFATDQEWRGGALWVGRLKALGIECGRIPQVVLDRRIHHTNMSREKTMSQVAELAFELHKLRRLAARPAVRE